MVKCYIKTLILLISFGLTAVRTYACPAPGTYTIGPSGTYTSITSAVAALTGCTLSGHYIFELQSSYVSSVETFPIVIPAFTGAGINSTVTFRPQTAGSNLSITSSASGIIRLDGADFIYFDGRAGGSGSSIDLTIENTQSATTAYAIQLINDATNNVIRYCNVKSRQTDNNNAGTIFFSTTTGTTGNDDNTIEYCNICDATGGTPANGIFSNGTTTSTAYYNSGNIISNNNIYNYFHASANCNGIYLVGANTNWTITGNSFFQKVNRTLGTNRSMSGIFIWNNTNFPGYFQVTGNIVGGNDANGSGTLTLLGAGLFNPLNFYVDPNTASTIQGNQVKNVSFTSTSTSTLQRLIGLFQGYINCSYNSISNITINWAGGGAILSGIGTGLTTTGSSNLGVLNVTNNSISNITLNVTGGTAARFWGIYVTDQPTTLTISQDTINNITSNADTTLRGICLLSNSTSNTITNNRITNFNQTSTGTIANITGIFTDRARSYTIRDNYISNLSSATRKVFVSGSNPPSTAISGITINSTGTSTLISKDTISALRSTNTGAVNTYVVGIATGQTTAGGTIERNRIWDLTNTTTSGSNAAAGIIPNGGSWTVANNMIAITNSPNTNALQCYGIYDGGAAGARKYYYNSIVIGGTASTGNNVSVALQFNTAAGASADIKNNILVMERSGGTGKNYTIANTGTNFSGFVSNNNILNNTVASTLGLSTGPADQTLSSWQTTSSGDAGSYTDITVPFTDKANGNLHIDMATLGNTPTVIESQGSVQTITNDYDNDTRPGPAGSANGGGYAPDIGADEVDAYPENKAPVISYGTLSTPNCVVNQTLVATITDNTGVPVSGSLMPRIYYRKNSGSWYSQAGTKTSGTAANGNWQFTINVSDMAPLSGGDVVQYYLTAQDIIVPAPNIGASPSTGFSATDVNTVSSAPVTPNSYTIDNSATGIWLGTSTDWTSSSNWCGGVPTSSTNVVIQPGMVNYPVITGTANVNNLDIGTNAFFTVSNGGQLTINGSFTNNGTLTNNGDIILNGSAVQYFPGSTGNIAAMKNLTVNNSYGTVFNRDMSITGTLTPSAGNIDLNNSIITLASTSSATARVGQVGGSFSYTGTGKFEVQRYIPARRAWRLMTAPLYATGSIYDNWQNGGVYQAGKGTLITGPNPSAANGLDASTQNNASLKSGSSLSNILNTKATNLSGSNGTGAENAGYFIFIRGDRNPVNTTFGNTNATTLSARGKLQYGSQLFSASATASSYTLLANPYASPVDFENVGRTNLVKRFYAWDPQLNQVGGYVLVDDYLNTGNYVVTPTSPGGLDRYIQSGQAFFVETETNGTASLNVYETSKSGVSTQSGFRPSAAPSSFRINLFLSDTGNVLTPADGILVQFDERFHEGIDVQDAIKFTNVNETLGLMRNGKLLVLERRPGIIETDTLYLRLTKTSARRYRFELEPFGMERNNLAAFLEDNLTGKSTCLNTGAKSYVDFSIGTDPASASPDRFKIVFRPVVQFLDFNAQLNGEDVVLKWSVNGENDIVRYEVERSVNGIDFHSVISRQATGNSSGLISYGWTDLRPSPSEYFYRVKCYNKAGSVAYSAVETLKILRNSDLPYILPNPVQGDQIEIYMANLPAGSYKISILNALGQEVKSFEIKHQQGLQLQLLPVSRAMPNGNYTLVINGLKSGPTLLPFLLNRNR